MSLGAFSVYLFEDYKAIKLIRRLFSSSAILIWELKKASPSNSCQQKNSASILPYFNITEKETKIAEGSGCFIGGGGKDTWRRLVAPVRENWVSHLSRRRTVGGEGGRERLCCRTKSSDWKCWDFEEEAFPKRFVTSVLFFGPDLREGKRDEGKRERSDNGDQSLVSGVLVDHHDGLHQHGHEVGARGRVHRRHPCHQWRCPWPRLWGDAG